MHALRSLRKEGWEGVWAEGRLWWSLAWCLAFPGHSRRRWRYVGWALSKPTP